MHAELSSILEWEILVGVKSEKEKEKKEKKRLELERERDMRGSENGGREKAKGGEGK